VGTVAKRNIVFFVECIVLSTVYRSQSDSVTLSVTSPVTPEEFRPTFKCGPSLRAHRLFLTALRRPEGAGGTRDEVTSDQLPVASELRSSLGQVPPPEAPAHFLREALRGNGDDASAHGSTGGHTGVATRGVGLRGRSARRSLTSRMGSTEKGTAQTTSTDCSTPGGTPTADQAPAGVRRHLPLPSLSPRPPRPAGPRSRGRGEDQKPAPGQAQGGQSWPCCYAMVWAGCLTVLSCWYCTVELL